MSFTVEIDLPPDVELEVLKGTRDVGRDVKEAFALSLFRTQRINHVELSQILGMDRFETDEFLQRHGVTEGTLTMEDLELQTEISRRVLKEAASR